MSTHFPSAKRNRRTNISVRSLTPPPLLEGGEGVRGRDGTLGFKPLWGIKDKKHITVVNE